MFESESAAKTALLLTNAMIVDRSIKVEPLLLSKATPPKSAEMAPGDIKHKAFDVHDHERVRLPVSFRRATDYRFSFHFNKRATIPKIRFRRKTRTTRDKNERKIGVLRRARRRS